MAVALSCVELRSGKACSGMLRHGSWGVAGSGSDRHVMVRQLRFGWVRLGMVRRGEARLGKAVKVGYGELRLGLAGHGWAWQGMVGLGKVWQLRRGQVRQLWLGLVGHGLVCSAMVWQLRFAKVRFGQARCVLARRGKVWQLRFATVGSGQAMRGLVWCGMVRYGRHINLHKY